MELSKEIFPQPEWPDEPYDIASSMCHWFARVSRKLFVRWIESLPPNPVYVEFGTFTGAGTTLTALQTRSDLQAICLDHWRINHRVALKFPPYDSHDPVTGELCGFLRGDGTVLQHCQNNLRGYRDRVKLVQLSTTHATVDHLANAGVEADCVLLDDDHTETAFVERLYRCRYRWPEALIICDDCNDSWPGVQRGVEVAFEKGFYTRDEFHTDGNMVAFKRKKKK